ncbi:ABC transporter permease [Lichenicoccus sp.]|uniref:ABC transporter permease n=1 Tax=Lichenicoccus sp. TaxID=2781899 RepID=UPI003D0C5E7B
MSAPGSALQTLGARLGLAALLTGLSAALLVVLSGHDPVAALQALASGAFGSRSRIGAGLDRSTPYLLAGVGVALCFRAGIINIGAEGQIAAGGLGATAAALGAPASGPIAAITLALLAGALAGALWSGLAALLHLVRGVHEVLATLLLNFVALLLVQFLLAGPLGQAGAGFLQSPPIPLTARLPRLPLLGVHLGFPLALLAAAGGTALLWRTRFGFGLRVLGASRSAARYAGFRLPVLTMLAMLLAGALAGLAGATEILGLHRRLVEGFSNGFGFRAVTVALLGLLEPVLVVPAALFVGFMEAGAQSMQREVGVPTSMVTVLEGLTVLYVLAATAHRARR